MEPCAALVKRGQGLAAEGKFCLARLVLERAAEAKSALAALTIARTYDQLTGQASGMARCANRYGNGASLV